jgi:hypothetical protein
MFGKKKAEKMADRAVEESGLAEIINSNRKEKSPKYTKDEKEIIKTWESKNYAQLLDRSGEEGTFIHFITKDPNYPLHGTDNEKQTFLDNAITGENYILFMRVTQASKQTAEVYKTQIKFESEVVLPASFQLDEKIQRQITAIYYTDPDKFNAILKSQEAFEKSVTKLQQTEVELKNILENQSKLSITTQKSDLETAGKINIIERIFNKAKAKQRKDILQKHGVSADELSQAIKIQGDKLEKIEQIEKIQKKLFEKLQEAQRKVITDLTILQDSRQEVLEVMRDRLARDNKISSYVTQKRSHVAIKRRFISLNYDATILQDREVELENKLGRLVNTLITDKITKPRLIFQKYENILFTTLNKIQPGPDRKDICQKIMDQIDNKLTTASIPPLTPEQRNTLLLIKIQLTKYN